MLLVDVEPFDRPDRHGHSRPKCGYTLTIFFEENCQVELIAPSGRRILIDVWNPAALSKPVAATDVLVTSHLHGDHYVPSFASSFPGKKIISESTQLKLDDLTVTSIAASHADDKKLASIRRR